MLTIAIQPDDQALRSGRRQSFSTRWEQLGREAGFSMRLINAYGGDLAGQLAGCDGFMWWFAHVPEVRPFAQRLLQAIEHGAGITVFPTWETIWHFDDKISEQYLLELAEIPTPKTWILWSEKEALQFCESAKYPIVVKLATGICSENVRIIQNFAEAQYYIHQLFKFGMMFLRRKSRRLGVAKHRLVESVRTLTGRPHSDLDSAGSPQRGYLLLQEFLAGNRFDTRVTVIGNRAFAFRRMNRDNDFRASGSGKIDWDPALIDVESVRLAFHVAGKLRMQSCAVDVLYRGEERVINEVNYYYEGWAVAACPGHWSLSAGGDLAWNEGPMAPEDAIFADFSEVVRK